MVGHAKAPVYAMPCTIAGIVPRRDGRFKVCKAVWTTELRRPLHSHGDWPPEQGVEGSWPAVAVSTQRQEISWPAIVAKVRVCGVPWPRAHGHSSHDIMDDSLARRRRRPLDTCVARRRYTQEPAAEQLPHRSFPTSSTPRFNEDSAEKQRCF